VDSPVVGSDPASGVRVMCWTEAQAAEQARRILEEDPSVPRVEIRYLGNLLRVIER